MSRRRKGGHNVVRFCGSDGLRRGRGERAGDWGDGNGPGTGSFFRGDFDHIGAGFGGEIVWRYDAQGRDKQRGGWALSEGVMH
jgi:hypothetical protein